MLFVSFPEYIFFSKFAVSFLRPPIPRSRIEFIFLVLVNVPFGHLTLCRTLIPTKSIQTFNQVFRRNYHLECKNKEKIATKEMFYMFWNMLLWLSIRLLFHLHHSKWQFRRKIPSSGLYSRLHVKFYTSITTKCSFFFSKMQVIIGWTPFFRPSCSKLGIIFSGWVHRYQTPTFKEACNACVRAQSMRVNLGAAK